MRVIPRIITLPIKDKISEVKADSTTIYDDKTIAKKQWPPDPDSKKFKTTGLKTTDIEVIESDKFPSFLKRADSLDKLPINKEMTYEEEQSVIKSQENRLSEKAPDYSKYENWKQQGFTKRGLPYGTLKLGNQVVEGRMVTLITNKPVKEIVAFLPNYERFSTEEIVAAMSKGRLNRLVKIRHTNGKKKLKNIKNGLPTGVWSYYIRNIKESDSTLRNEYLDIIYMDNMTGLASIPYEKQVEAQKLFFRDTGIHE